MNTNKAGLPIDRPLTIEEYEKAKFAKPTEAPKPTAKPKTAPKADKSGDAE